MKADQRIHIAVSRPMRLALEDLAYRNASTVSAEARRVLRQGLDRSINSAAIQMRLRQEGYVAGESTPESARDEEGASADTPTAATS